MGYIIRIGDAEPFLGMENNRLYAEWRVSPIELKESPPFWHCVPICARSDSHKNYVDYSYGGRDKFIKSAGIYELFMNEEVGLMRDHPGCFLLERCHYLKIKAALEKMRAIVALNDYDNAFYPTLIQLTWFEWWIKWAIHACRTPAIENG